MKKIILTVLFLMSFHLIEAQNVKFSPAKTKNFIAFTPSSVTQVNGLMVDFFDTDESLFRKINGVELGLNPVGVFIPFLVGIHLVFSPLSFQNSKGTPRQQVSINDIAKEVNGLQFTLWNFNPTRVNGFELNVGGSNDTFINGISVSPLLSNYSSVNGLGISLLNDAYKFRGMQIGVVNGSQDFRGVQIGVFNLSSKTKGIQLGIWNKNEKRSLPIINWNF